MQYNSHNPNYNFAVSPEEFSMHSDIELLKYCLGATLYMPGTKDITMKVIRKELSEVHSIVMCMEDAIQVEDLANAEKNILNHLNRVSEAISNNEISVNDIPLTFVRVRSLNQFESFSRQLNQKNTLALSGFVFPKFYSNNAEAYLERLEELRNALSPYLYGMPILEGKSIAYQETRTGELQRLKSILMRHQKAILNIRVGGTDFSALFGVRRGINYSIYDILSVKDCLTDILNFFNRASDGFLVSGPVWEYFLAYKDDDIRKLNGDIHRSILNRQPILNEAMDGLLREVILDKANGFVGKTIIHPSHARFVNALQSVTQEEYDDAMQILNTSGGVIKSQRSNKMNEINPHKSWAKKIITRARAFGVVESDQAYLDLLSNY
ncbi:MAG: HpcH/HpaI aldolase/citrate lyase family protein [Cyclobacteriaceae bacterium]